MLKFNWKKIVARFCTIILAPAIATYFIGKMNVRRPSIENLIRILEWPSLTLRLMWLALLPSTKMETIDSIYDSYVYGH